MRMIVYVCVTAWLVFLPAMYSHASEKTLEARLTINGDYHLALEGLPAGVTNVGAITTKHPDQLTLSIAQDSHIFVSDLRVTMTGALMLVREILITPSSSDQPIIFSVY